ncbi:MAG: TetR/AcrR family transcriptional regulator [Actinomycetota bacterium]
MRPNAASSEAASLEYQENGVEETSMQAVARRAEVAPGTVLYHYPTPESLAKTVVESWPQSMEPPTPDAIDEKAPLEERVTQLARELFRLYERTGHLYRVYQQSPDHPSTQKASRWWFENVHEMLVRALGRPRRGSRGHPGRVCARQPGLPGDSDLDRHPPGAGH